jgi:uncharacterized protein
MISVDAPAAGACSIEQQRAEAAVERKAAEVGEVVNNEAQSRYEAHSTDGELMGWLDYEDQGDVRVTTHTVTKPEFRGQGVASKMTRRVFEDAVESGKQIDPACWYVAEFIQHNPRYSRQVVDLGF